MKEIEKFWENLPKHFGHILACEVIDALPNFFGGQTSKSRARQAKCYRESSFTRGRHNEDGMKFYLNEIYSRWYIHLYPHQYVGHVWASK